MRLRIFFDGIPHEIDSIDPDLLARWIIEIFGRLTEINRGTIIEFQANPSFLYDGEIRQWRPDWSADSRITGRIYPIKSPRELVGALTEQLAEMGARADGH